MTRPKEAVTIWDVADRAGVSKSTVSRYLSRSGPVGSAAGERIRAATEELGYVPNSAARAMRTRRTGNLAFLVPDYANPFYIELFKEIEVSARNRGYAVQMMSTHAEDDRSFSWLGFLKHRVDGMLNCSYDRRPATIKRFMEIGAEMPMVFMDPWYRRDVTFSSVVADGFGGNADAVDHLVRQGRRRIAYFKGLKRIIAGRERYLGYCEGLRRNGIAHDPALVQECPFADLMGSGYAAAQDLIRSGAGPDAIIGLDDLIAIGAMRGLAALGVRVPEDVAVVGFDNIGLCDIVEPNLTSIAQPVKELGRAGLELLLRQIAEGERRHESIVIPTTLVVRRSSDARMRNRMPAPDQFFAQ